METTALMKDGHRIPDGVGLMRHFDWSSHRQSPT